jgi:uncharacterized protein (TIGR02594 family)
MKKIELSAFDVARRFVGLQEIPGPGDNPLVLAMLELDQAGAVTDEVPWCSAFVNYITWLLQLPRSRSLSARSWLLIGRPVALDEAEAGFDVVIVKRGDGEQPGPEVLEAPGHVGFYAGREGNDMLILGGNQNNSVCVAKYPEQRLLGIRRLI